MKEIDKGSLYGLLLIAGILLTWQTVSEARLIPIAFLPPVSAVLIQLYESFVNSGSPYSIAGNMIPTLERVFGGFLLSVIVAVPLGLIIGSSRKIYNLLRPSIEVLRVLPPVALIPVFILLIGINEEMFVAFVAFGCTWPIMINTIDGVRNVDPLLFDVSKSFGKRYKDTFLRVTFPASSPFIVSGMRVSLLVALLLAVVIEMTSGHNGLGYSTVYAQMLSNVRAIYAEIFLIAALGFVLNFLFVRLENHFMKWHKISK